MKLYKYILILFLMLTNYVSLLGENWDNVKNKGKGTITVFYYNSDNFISDATGKLKGIEYDIFMEFKKYIKAQNIELTVVFKKAESFPKLYEEIKHGGSGEFAACSFSMTEKRMKEVLFSPKYMPDIEVLINSNNIAVAKDEEEFVKLFSGLTALNVPNTTFEEDLLKLKGVIPNLKVQDVDFASTIRERILVEPDLFGYIELPTYLQLFKEGIRFKRQNLYKVERNGYGIILPLNSDWIIPINDFFETEEFKLKMNQIIKKHLGEGVNELLWKIDDAEANTNHQEISLLTMEREFQEKEIKQQAFKVQMLIVGVVVILIITFLLFYGYRMKKMVNTSLTERNLMIEKQKDELERLSLVASKTSNGVVILDANNNTEWLNESYTLITGYNLETLKGKSPGDLLIGDDIPKDKLDRIRKYVEAKKPWRERILIKKKTGEKIWIEINSTPVLDEKGEVSKYIEIIDDVTEKVQNEVELKRLSIIAEKMNEAVMIADSTGKIEYYNDSLVRNSGFTKEEFNQRFKGLMYLQKLSTREDIQEVIEKFKTNPEPFFYDSPHEKSDGSVMWTTASMSPVYDENNNLSKIIVVYTDISERKIFANQLSEKNKEIVDSINYAKVIQDALLPSENVLKSNFEDYFILFKPKDIVSGDFYWFEHIGDYCILILADCTGHGVPGALMSMMGSNFLSSIISDNAITTTNDALMALDLKVKKALQNENASSRDGMDIVMMAYNLKTGVLDFSGGKNSIFIYRDGELLRYKGDRFSIGSDGLEEKEFTEQNIKLHKGDIVYTFTDGFQDQFGGDKGKKFMQKKLLELLVGSVNESMESQKNNLENNLTNWMQGYDQVDDISIIGFKI